MCYFITLIIDKSESKIVEEKIDSEISLWRCENKNIMSHFDSEYYGYALTTGMCSCDLYHDTSRSASPEEITAKLKNKYRKKGWSELKIHRAIESSIVTRKTKLVGLRADAREFIANIVESSKRAWVLVHWYSGDQVTEKVEIKLGQTVSLVDFRAGDYTLESDTLVTLNA